ncbi:MAG: CBS domain-containing protein [Algoriphagus sp.]|uniref:DUF294 nucleotidyltransferase-like domain-containing protein n=1 Tax=Algoriphagus sp. TaxID=1872435 RepID=UPI0017B49C25|nr:DUF294 nucleotidyltransferase-like domain-containing protein [Algoriphagus sp.]NVJ87122.1 CBS domain-containing protein [Algoriphagus sp.]
MSNVIINRVAEFLRRHPPFSFLEEGDLLRIAQSVEISYLAKGEVLFRKGEPANPHFFILKEGQILLQEEGQIREYCDVGDLFGVLALLGKRPYVLDALAGENSLIYAVPVEEFEKLLEKNPKVSLYFAAGFAAGQVVFRTDLGQGQKAREVFGRKEQDHSLLIFSGQSTIQISKNVLTCKPSDSVQEAAYWMDQQQVSSIVICDESKFPIGILTDKDLRSKVLAKGLSTSLPVSEIMSSPVITKKPESDFAELYLSMIKNRLHHLVLTEDGTDQSPVCGILSDHDVLLSMGNSPAVIIHALINARSNEEMGQIRDRAEEMLRYYLENEVAMDFVAAVMTEINDVIIQRAIEEGKKLLIPKFPEVGSIPFAFLSMGSEGREEQLLRTDQDNALVYGEVPESLQEKARAYFQELGTYVVETLLACGFASCPGEIMASNSKWVLPISSWKAQFSEWILHPSPEALMKSSIFFDFRVVAGTRSLGDELTSHIFDEIKKKPIFLNFLAQNALQNPPPLGFFRNFLVEKSGEHRDQFDIKARAMLPLTDLARLLILYHGIPGINNTFKRFEKLSELEPNYRDLFIQAAKAYEILMRMRALEGLQERNSGRFIAPEKLGKIQRNLLKNSFSPIQELQEIVQVRFQLDYFRS